MTIELDIYFATTKLRRTVNDEAERVRAYGPERSRHVGRRVDQLLHSANLAVFRAVHRRCHELKGDRAGLWSADVGHPVRLLFQPADDPLPLAEDGGLDVEKVTSVTIISVEDTH